MPSLLVHRLFALARPEFKRIGLPDDDAEAAAVMYARDAHELLRARLDEVREAPARTPRLEEPA